MISLPLSFSDLTVFREVNSAWSSSHHSPIFSSALLTTVLGIRPLALNYEDEVKTFWKFPSLYRLHKPASMWREGLDLIGCTPHGVIDSNQRKPTEDNCYKAMSLTKCPFTNFWPEFYRPQKHLAQEYNFSVAKSSPSLSVTRVYYCTKMSLEFVYFSIPTATVLLQALYYLTQII